MNNVNNITVQYHGWAFANKDRSERIQFVAPSVEQLKTVVFNHLKTIGFDVDTRNSTSQVLRVGAQVGDPVLGGIEADPTVKINGWTLKVSPYWLTVQEAPIYTGAHINIRANVTIFDFVKRTK